MEANKYNRIVLVGTGWGAIAAFKGLQNMGLPLLILSDDEYFEKNASKAVVELLDLHDELIIFAGYKPIVPEYILERNLCVNIHYSLLPKYRGFHSTVWAILNEEPFLGLTVHIMDKYIDNGPIIFQYEVLNDHTGTSRYYMELFNDYISLHLGEIILKYLNGEIQAKPQDKKQASWVGRRKLEDCRINFNERISYQKAFFRALVSPYPLPYIEYNGSKLYVTDVDYQYCDLNTHIGRILNVDDDGIWIKVPDGYMIIKSLIDEKGEKVSMDIFKIGKFLNK